MILAIKVKPNSRQDKITKENGLVVVRVHAPAVEGKANKALVDFLSEAIDIPRSGIEVVSGHTSPHKKIAIADTFRDKVEGFLGTLG